MQVYNKRAEDDRQEYLKQMAEYEAYQSAHASKVGIGPVDFTWHCKYLQLHFITCKYFAQKKSCESYSFHARMMWFPTA